MTKNQKIVLGVGAVVVLIYAYFKNLSITKTSVSAPTDPNNPRTPTNPNNGGVVPPIYNDFPKKTTNPIASVETFEFIKDYQSDPNRATTRMISWNFVKGQKIKGIPDYSKCAVGGGVCPVLTTTKGELQGKQNQMYWITIPQGYLKVSS